MKIKSWHFNEEVTKAITITATLIAKASLKTLGIVSQPPCLTIWPDYETPQIMRHCRQPTVNDLACSTL